MTDLAIAAVSGAGVTIAVAIGMLVLGLRLSDAEQRATVAQIDAANRKAQTTVDAATITTLREQLAIALKRGDALYDELSKASTAFDPVNAASRVLARWRADGVSPESAAGSAAGAVSEKPAAASSGSDDGGAKPR